MNARDHHHKRYIPKERRSKPLLRIYCEGATEKYYFDSIKYSFKSQNSQVKLKIKEKKEAQVQLIDSVEKLITYENINLEDDKEDFI